MKNASYLCCHSHCPLLTTAAQTTVCSAKVIRAAEPPGRFVGRHSGRPGAPRFAARASSGNALMHEMRGTGPDDPITMVHLDGDRLILTHYCDAGNQPRMAATISPDGRTIVFDFVEATNLESSQHGHMQRVIFNFIDADHHTEKMGVRHGRRQADGWIIRPEAHQVKTIARPAGATEEQRNIWNQGWISNGTTTSRSIVSFATGLSL